MTRYEVIVKCSRCKELVNGRRGLGFTQGFYNVSKGYWKSFARPNEKRLCDTCMHESPEYQLVYGVLLGLRDTRASLRGRMIQQRTKAIAEASNPAHTESCCITGPKSPTLIKISNS